MWRNLFVCFQSKTETPNWTNEYEPDKPIWNIRDYKLSILTESTVYIVILLVKLISVDKGGISKTIKIGIFYFDEYSL